VGQQLLVVGDHVSTQRGLQLPQAALQALCLRLRARARPGQHAARELGGVEGRVEERRQRRVLQDGCFVLSCTCC
jgi:hypothetical protein